MKPWNDQQAIDLIQQAKAGDQALTTAMRNLADTFGYIDDAAIAPLAQTFSRSKAEVVGVLHYYSDFRTQKPGRTVLRICQAEACQAVGATNLTKEVCKQQNLALGETGADGELTLEPVYCLGLCANGPAAEINGTPIAHADAKRIAQALNEAKT
jgi:formate dehydrogenase subunit gamma